MAVNLKTSLRALPPELKTAFPGQHLAGFIRNPTGLFTRAAQSGDIVRLNLGPNTYLINHPDYIRDILVTNQRIFTKSAVLQRMRGLLGDGLITSEGELHLRQRRLIQPAFHRQRIAGYAKLMTDCAQQASDHWKDGQVLNIHTEMMRLTMVIVGQALFGKNVEGEAADIGQAITQLFHGSRRLRLPFYEQIVRLPLPSNRRLFVAGQRLDTLIYAMIADRQAALERGESGKHNDLLDMLLQARDETGDAEGMGNRLVRDEALTLFLAGHETTANALTWTWYLLSQHPDAENRLHEELARVFEGRIPSADDVENLPYTRRVFSESMRLYPPVWVISRQAQVDYPVGGYILPAGSTLLMSQWVMHHDPRFFPDPDRFDPDRWIPELVAARPKFSYFPFGGGARVCVGEPFAWMEGILILASLAQRWQMRAIPSQKIELLPQVTLRPKYGMRMVLKERSIRRVE